MKDESAPELTVIAPLYGNAGSLRELVSGIEESLRGIDWELVLVDDASPDGCGLLAEELAAADLRVRAIRLPRNVGQNEALRAGVLASLGRKIAFIDADLQDPPAILPRLLAASQDAEIVFGIRRGHYQSWPRRLSSKIYKAIRSRLCRVPSGAGLLLLAQGSLLRLIAENAPAPCWWIPHLGEQRKRVAALAVERSPRPQGRSAYRGLMRWRVGLAELARALRLRAGAIRSSNLLKE